MSAPIQTKLEPFAWRKVWFERKGRGQASRLEGKAGLLLFVVREWDDDGDEGKPRFSAEAQLDGVRLAFAFSDGWIDWGTTPRRALAVLWRRMQAEHRHLTAEAQRFSQALTLARIHFRHGPPVARRAKELVG